MSFFFFKQKTAYEMRIRDWSSDVCSSDLIASFVLAHERFIAERNTPRYEAARERLAGTMLLVDETSMVSASDMLKLHQISAAMGVDKLVLVGDRQQLSSIDWGKAFAMIQAAGATMVRMTQNIRIGKPGQDRKSTRLNSSN